MKRLPVRFQWVGVALVLGVAGSATAQPAGRAADAEVGFEHKAQLSPQDELAQADGILSRLDQAAGTVRRQLEGARAARDVVKSLCLNDKLSQIDVAARSARERQAALQSAVQRSDSELANHEFTILTVLRQRAEQLNAEANQCIGEDMAFVGQTEVHMDVERNMPGDDMTYYPPIEPGGGGTTSPPPCASCTGM